jgi:hypothetical protein
LETKGSVFTVTVYYNGEVYRRVFGDTRDIISWGDTHLLYGTPWYPMPTCQMAFDSEVPILPTAIDRHNATVHLYVPDNHTAIAPGELVSKTTGSGMANFTYSSGVPLLGISVASAEFVVNTTTHGGVNITTYMKEDNATKSGSFIDEAKAILDFYSNTFSVAYPFTDLNLIAGHWEFGAMHTAQGMVIIEGETMNYTVGAGTYLNLARSITNELLVHRITVTGEYQRWLVFGIGEYMASYYQVKEKGINNNLKSSRNLYNLNYIPVEPSIKNATNLNNDMHFAIVIHKGSWVLHMMRYLVGNTTFENIMTDFFAIPDESIIDLDDFIGAVEGRGVTNLKWFFEQWLNTSKAIDYEMTSAVLYEEDGQLKIELEVNEKKKNGGRMPVDVTLIYPDTSKEYHFKLLKGDSSETISLNVTGVVDQVKLDSEDWLLDVVLTNQIVYPTQGDIVAKSLSITPTDITEGDDIDISCEVKNDAGETFNILVRFYSGNTSIGTDTIANLAHGDTDVAELTWETEGFGNKTIMAVADADDVVLEINESNNIITKEITIKELVPDPDFYFMGPIVFSRTDLTEDESVLINATVVNDHPNARSGITVSFFVDGALIDNQTLGTIPGGGNQTTSVGWTTTSGEHTISAKVDPNNKILEMDETNNEITKGLYVNARPFAVLDVDEDEPFTNEEITFSGTGSVDDGQIVEYYFDFGDGTNSGWVTNSEVSKIYNTSGDFQATLRVKDNMSAQSDPSTAVSILVQNTRPVSNFTVSPSSGDVTTIFTFKSTSYDPDGEVKTYFWDFGDHNAAADPEVTHQYRNDGHFTVRLMVIDNDNLQSEQAEQVIEVKNLGPTARITASPTELYTGDTVTLDATQSSDPDEKLSELRFKWTTDDGRSIGTKDKVDYKPMSPGDITITCVVTDDDGATDSAEVTIKVNQRPTTNGGNGDDGESPMLLYVGGSIAAIVVIIIILGALGIIPLFGKKKAVEEEEAVPRKKKAKKKPPAKKVKKKGATIPLKKKKGTVKKKKPKVEEEEVEVVEVVEEGGEEE